MPLIIDTLGQSLPMEIRSAIDEASTLFREDCVVSFLGDQTTDTCSLRCGPNATQECST